MDLGMVVRLWPTPSARDWKDNPGAWMWNATNPDGTHRNRTDQLPRKVYAVEGTVPNGGQLNPTWVEWLMGFPIGHTDLEPSETP
jgi:DNA (cytosine-5)-methyltransferase 1